MNELHTGFLIGLIVVLILLSAFFSGSETSMLSLNRYRLKHLSKHKKSAKRAAELLDRPERLIGMILIGNNLVNIFASSIATVIALRMFGDVGIAISTLILTLLILIFAEITPKTIAAYYPEKFAFPITGILKFLLKVFFPFVWLLNTITKGILLLFGLNPEKSKNDQISVDELRTIVSETNDLIPNRHQGMLLNILDIEDASVEDIMIPRNEILAIDINDDEDKLLQTIRDCNFTRLPVYEDDIDNIIGILHMRNLGKFFTGNVPFSRKSLRTLIREPVFTPETTNLHQQLINFQKDKRRVSIVVDEYGSVKGLVTLEDILEEIVGEFTSNLEEDTPDFEITANGAHIIQGSATVRDINRFTGWHLPLDGPKTFNGLIIEQLENFPDAAACVRINNIAIEITDVKGNFVEKVKAYEL